LQAKKDTFGNFSDIQLKEKGVTLQNTDTIKQLYTVYGEKCIFLHNINKGF